MHNLIFKILFRSGKKNGINIDASFHMTVNKNNVHCFKSMVNTETNE